MSIESMILACQREEKKNNFCDKVNGYRICRANEAGLRYCEFCCKIEVEQNKFSYFCERSDEKEEEG